jgi:hypothetical protein
MPRCTAEWSGPGFLRLTITVENKYVKTLDLFYTLIIVELYRASRETEGDRIMQATYDYPQDGGYADTVATLADGRKLWINTQYSNVVARHAAGCHKGPCSISLSNVCAEGARRRAAACTCGALAGVDDVAMVADARINGKFGRPPVVRAAAPVAAQIKHGFGWCDKCESYCYGDCTASA